MPSQGIKGTFPEQNSHKMLDRACCLSLFTVWKGQGQPLPLFGSLIHSTAPSKYLVLGICCHWRKLSHLAELLSLLCDFWPCIPVKGGSSFHIQNLKGKKWISALQLLLFAVCTYWHCLCWPWRSFRYCQTWTQRFHPAGSQTLKERNVSILLQSNR